MCQSRNAFCERDGERQSAKHQHHADADAAGALFFLGQAGDPKTCFHVHGSVLLCNMN
jgi:hypothetical protein